MLKLDDWKQDLLGMIEGLVNGGKQVMEWAAPERRVIDAVDRATPRCAGVQNP